MVHRFIISRSTPLTRDYYQYNSILYLIENTIDDIWLVVRNMFIFPYIGNVIIPINFNIFQRGRYSTNQIGFMVEE